MGTKLQFLDEAIASQHGALRFQKILACATIATGVTVMVCSPFIAKLLQAETMKALLALGGAFCGSLAGFPIKDLTTRKQKVAALRFIRAEYASLESAQPGDERLARLDQQFTQFLSKALEA